MARSAAAKVTFTESELTKGQVRKLNALRKSIGEEIAHKAFADWLTSRPEAVEEVVDKNASAYLQNMNKITGETGVGKLSIAQQLIKIAMDKKEEEEVTA